MAEALGTMKNPMFHLLLILTGLTALVLFGQPATVPVIERRGSDAGDVIAYDRTYGVFTNYRVGMVVITNTASDLRIFHTLQTNWVPVETLTGKREVGIVISNTYARVMWNWKTNDYIQESVVIGQTLVREPLSDFTTNVFIIQPSRIPTNFIWR